MDEKTQQKLRKLRAAMTIYSAGRSGASSAKWTHFLHPYGYVVSVPARPQNNKEKR